MTLTPHQKIRVGFGLLLILPTLLCLLAVRQIDRLIKSAEAEAFTEKVLTHFEETSSMLKDVEMDQREYMLTGDESFLTSFWESKKKVFAQIESIEKETGYSRRLQYNIDLLKNVVQEKFFEIERTNEVRRTGGLEAAASDPTRNNLGKLPMDDIRRLLTKMIDNEREALHVTQTEQRKNFYVTLAVFAVVLLLNFFFVFFLRYFMKREAVEHEREEQRFRELNVELERRVHERTQQLQRSNEDLQQFAYMVSHDLKEPLRMVASYTELLQRRYAGRLDEQADEFIGFAVQGVRRMRAMIEDMLNYSRATEVPPDELSSTSAQDALDGALENLRMRIQETGAKITHDEMPVVAFDPVRLTQLFQNLIGNSLKYRSEAPPLIHVSIARNSEETIFGVKDNGIGIAPEHKENVFGVFQRLHGQEFEGTGIGLATCKKIIERRGGRIWFESEPGKGSTFYFSVPAAVEEKSSAPDNQLVARE